MRHAENRQRLRRMGISGALVAILLVVVAIAFVGIAVAVMGGYLGTASVKTDIMIEKLDLVAKRAERAGNQKHRKREDNQHRLGHPNLRPSGTGGNATSINVSTIKRRARPG